MEMFGMFKKNKPWHNEPIFIINVSKMPKWNVWIMRKNQHVIDFLKFGNYNTVMLYAIGNEKEDQKWR